MTFWLNNSQEQYSLSILQVVLLTEALIKKKGAISYIKSAGNEKLR
jgi:hypothetical protein